jgi:hypothetical protein
VGAKLQFMGTPKIFLYLFLLSSTSAFAAEHGGSVPNLNPDGDPCGSLADDAARQACDTEAARNFGAVSSKSGDSSGASQEALEEIKLSGDSTKDCKKVLDSEISDDEKTRYAAEVFDPALKKMSRNSAKGIDLQSCITEILSKSSLQKGASSGSGADNPRNFQPVEKF